MFNYQFHKKLTVLRFSLITLRMQMKKLKTKSIPLLEFT